MLFVPTGRPAFKQDRLVTAGEVRLAMVAAAVAGNPAFAVSALEVERPGVTYAVDTLRELREELPGVELVFIVGADAALTLPRWRQERRTGTPRGVRGAPRGPASSWGSRPCAILRERRIRCASLRRAGPRHFLERAAPARVPRGAPSAISVPEAVRKIIEEESLYRRESRWWTGWRSDAILRGAP